MNVTKCITSLNKYKIFTYFFFLLAGLTTITACSSGSSSTASGVEGEGSSALLTGVFLDAPVAGLNYQTATMSGLTDEEGTFMYREGESITFSIGDVMLGSGLGDHIMTPIDLVPGALDETDPTVTNICRLLQSIDWDGDVSNGIMINDTIRAEMSGRMIDFTKTIGEFNDYDIGAFFETMNALGGFHGGERRELQTPAEAQNHFRQMLIDNDMYFGNTASGSNQSGTGMGGMSRTN